MRSWSEPNVVVNIHQMGCASACVVALWCGGLVLHSCQEWSCVVDEPARGMRHSAGDDGGCVCALRQEDGARRDVVQVGAF